MTNYKTAFTRRGRADIRAIVRYIAKESSLEIAEAYGQAINTFCEEIGIFPHGGTGRPDLSPGARMVGFRRRVTIIFRVSDEQRLVTILGVFYGGRSAEKAFSPTQ